jgi:hypothetical protein
MRAKLLKEIAEPMVAKSSTEREDPTRTIPYTENADPIRA